MCDTHYVMSSCFALMMQDPKNKVHCAKQLWPSCIMWVSRCQHTALRMPVTQQLRIIHRLLPSSL